LINEFIIIIIFINIRNLKRILFLHVSDSIDNLLNLNSEMYNIHASEPCPRLSMIRAFECPVSQETGAFIYNV